MSGPADTYERYDYWRPPGTRWLESLLQRVDHVFDWIYSSRYNPLHRTGTLASLFLSVALVTGVYLLFVYEIGRPYESMVAIQNDVFLGRWIRALHRYASDAAVIAVALHVLRLLVQGKTWGPRALAWITGLLLAGMMFLSALTGFVLVWDEFGQKLAVAGAKMLRVLPLFPEPPDRSFVGDKPVPSQFFFMNLFLHVAIPLGMIGFLWLHTSKLARAAWFPERKVVWGTVIGFVLLSLVWPAPLPPAADLLAIPGRVDADWFYSFWLPVAHGSPGAGLAGAVILTGLLLAVPWWLRPRAGKLPPPAFVDPDKCEGCQQCFQDCPYDAIQMVPGKHPEVHPLRADIQPSLCVSCGICAGSCASLAIGPEARTAWHQLASARQLVSSAVGSRPRTLVVACRNNGGVSERVRTRLGADGSAECFEVDCAGTLHPGTVSYLAGHFGGTVILGCPPRNCVHREGAMLADARILMERRPAVPGRIAQQSVRVLHYSMGEWPRILSAIDAFTSPSSLPRGKSGGTGLRIVMAAGFSAILLGLVALGSRWPQGATADHALLRLGWRLAGQVKERCRDLTPEEMAKRPVHMRTPRECVSEVLTYDLKAVVDGEVVTEKRVKSPGLRADRPLSVEEDLEVLPGEHAVTVTFTPADAGSGGKVLSFERKLRFDRKRVVLITYENDALIAR
jgi:ferredoxin/coenzyme F420-reducing hydrogenase delta subunit